MKPKDHHHQHETNRSTTLNEQVDNTKPQKKNRSKLYETETRKSYQQLKVILFKSCKSDLCGGNGSLQQDLPDC